MPPSGAVRTRSLLIMTAAVGALVLMVPPASEAAAACTSGWSVMSTPDFGGDPAVLSGVSALADDDAWAVGFVGFAQQGLILRWDGVQWTQVESPAEPSDLQDVVALDASHVWTVGQGQVDFVAEWQGSSWQPYPVPGVPPGSMLAGVGGTGLDDVWAVGSDAAQSNLPLIAHWDGASWTRSPTVPLGQPVVLNAVAPVAPDDVWAVGYRVGTDFRQRPLILHWDGATWTVTESPGGVRSAAFEDVAALSSTDVIAVGTVQSANQSRTLVERWDGTRWAALASPNPSHARNELHGLSATATDGVWAVGTMQKPGGTSVDPELILQWNGGWAVQPGPRPDAYNDLMSVGVVGHHRFAVGSHTSENGGDVNHILAEDSCS